MQLSFKQVSHTYMGGTPFEHQALHRVSLTIPTGCFAVVIGPTGSGKSTLVQHMNGLLRPTAGEVRAGAFHLTPKKNRTSLLKLRQSVGFLFQYPEHQLFEETIKKELMFGPINFGVAKEEAETRAEAILPKVGLSPELLPVSPLQLSGGQMRRVAIASILAQHPELLILDEPAAGLDPEGREVILNMLYEYHQQHNQTTVLVTHHMEDALRLADLVIVMNKGAVFLSGTPEEVFSESKKLESIGLELPETIRFMRDVKNSFGLPEVPFLKTRSEVVKYLTRLLSTKGKGGV
ncbi:energy-coupling factor transporter ATPase [Alkalicoccobacillus murimartini]|uniref:Energy-coupling factor transporter ATP-binding protein EcfA2 n=1 Tax=Alkalicoccobacillus murimartini TaxID=171685 RepID=A0ABT9YN60_9BACI|nr:energy-coupling factor transporter ATPase [Alkalicoccobacillus murimartini]MDQ0209297.1 energy-coupling factor transport system ATP-binding protein [Alkalicoccobacillus murimartini]